MMMMMMKKNSLFPDGDFELGSPEYGAGKLPLILDF
jgi:hypothetical protein